MQPDLFTTMDEQVNSFFNSIGLTGQELKAANNDAAKQEDLVLEMFRISASMTASTCRQGLMLKYGKDFLIVSVRRAISNLAKCGKLRKTDIKQGGPYGKPEHVYALA